MNRPTIDVDDLLELADEAINAGDEAEAVAILRKAATIAPLRRDIRNRLALVLEGTPVTVKPARRKRATPQTVTFEDDPPEYGEFEQSPDALSTGRDSISQIARKAFDAAAQHKAKASDATRRLTNLLHTGLDSWKSSMTAAPNTAAKPRADEPAVTATAQSIVFRPEEELKQYLERAAPDNPSGINELYDSELDEADTSRITKPAAVSRKASRSATSTKIPVKRPTDVEDVLAAGIGGFIEAFGRMNKGKLVYALIYIGLIGSFGYACFDVSRKFPALEVTVPNVQTASLTGPALDVSTNPMSSEEALEKSKALVAEGKLTDAIVLLRAQLDSGRLLHNRDLLRVELASLLNVQAEDHLKANRLADSVKSYREALSYLSTDARLQLRLANALYYLGEMGTGADSEKDKALAEANTVISALIKGDSQNIQAHRLQALVHDARNEKSMARSSWQKVKTLAPAESAILAEAKSHLK